MTDPKSRKHLRDVAPGVEEDLGVRDSSDEEPTPEEPDPKVEPIPRL